MLNPEAEPLSKIWKRLLNYVIFDHAFVDIVSLDPQPVGVWEIETWMSLKYPKKWCVFTAERTVDTGAIFG